jgi:predicted metalloprotease
MRSGLHRPLLAAAVGALLLTGCSTVVAGTASPGGNVVTDVSSQDFPITAATDDDPVDQAARNALTDLYTFWGEEYPKAFGEDFQTLQGGIYSVDLADLDPSQFPDGVGCGADPTEVEGSGAFFCAGRGLPNSDSVTYDKNFLTELAGDYGRSLVPFVMAHEFGHAIQYRFGFRGESINQETQADCFAGAWTRWVVDGQADHVAIRVPELDKIIRGYLITADTVGSDPNEEGAHGSYFDRVSAIAEGYDNGVQKCRDDFGSERVFTAAEFTREDRANQGNSPYDETLTLTENSLPTFWSDVFPAAFGTDFQAPELQGFDGTAPDCVAGNRDLGYCAGDNAVYFDEQDLTRPAHDDIGDFAAATAISLPYALAARDQAGLSTDDSDATRSAACLTGWWQAYVFNGNDDQVRLQPGDIDEAVSFLLTYGTDDQVFPNTALSGFELLRAYRAGFLGGGSQCDVGIDG